MPALPADSDNPLRDASLASALAGIFRGRFCDILLRDRVAASTTMGDSLRCGR